MMQIYKYGIEFPNCKKYFYFLSNVDRETIVRQKIKKQEKSFISLLMDLPIYR